MKGALVQEPAILRRTSRLQREPDQELSQATLAQAFGIAQPPHRRGCLRRKREADVSEANDGAIGEKSELQHPSSSSQELSSAMFDDEIPLEPAWEWLAEFDVAPPTPPELDEFQLDPQLDIAPPPPPDMPLMVANRPDQELSSEPGCEENTVAAELLVLPPLRADGELEIGSAQESVRPQKRACGKPPDSQSQASTKQSTEAAADAMVPAPGTPRGRRDSKWRKIQDVAPPTAEKPKSPARRRATNLVDSRTTAKSAAMWSNLKSASLSRGSSESWADGGWSMAISARDGIDSFLDAKDAVRQDSLLERLALICPVVASIGALEPQTPPEKRQKLEFSCLVDQVTTGRQPQLRGGGSIQVRNTGKNLGSLGVDRGLVLRSKSRDFFLEGVLQMEAEMQ